MKILVRNLDRVTTEDELKSIFEEFGMVQSCTLVVEPSTGASKGFGFVEMPKGGEAKAAIKKINDRMVGNSKIRVKKADDKKD